MRNFVAECNAFSADSAMTRFSVDFCGGASPEGPARLNGRLAKERLDNAVAAMKEAGFDFGRFHSEGLHTAGTAIADWGSFAESVSADSLVPDRNEVLAVMKDTVLTASDREKKLKSIRGGYGTILRNTSCRRHVSSWPSSAAVQTSELKHLSRSFRNRKLKAA